MSNPWSARLDIAEAFRTAAIVAPGRSAGTTDRLRLRSAGVPVFGVAALVRTLLR